MQKSKEYLEKSIRCYQLMLEHVHNFKQSLEGGALTPKQYNSFNEKLVSLQKKVEEADKQFAEHFDQQSETLIMNNLFEEKKSMMKEILELNDYLLPRLASLMDITRDELSSLKTNMRNVGGYHSGKNSKASAGRIIRRSC